MSSARRCAGSIRSTRGRDRDSRPLQRQPLGVADESAVHGANGSARPGRCSDDDSIRTLGSGRRGGAGHGGRSARGDDPDPHADRLAVELQRAPVSDLSGQLRILPSRGRHRADVAVSYESALSLAQSDPRRRLRVAMPPMKRRRWSGIFGRTRPAGPRDGPSARCGPSGRIPTGQRACARTVGERKSAAGSSGSRDRDAGALHPRHRHQ